ncbi:DNA/RNA non-specific endonuclease [Clostridium butyricum]|uniref:hypothetical protein n=1 Tax=Clostridium butyricum TaxID=1492 RepID=UPI00374FBF09
MSYDDLIKTILLDYKIYSFTHDPNTIDKEVGDHAGHLFRDRFGGSPELDNLTKS